MTNSAFYPKASNFTAKKQSASRQFHFMLKCCLPDGSDCLHLNCTDFILFLFEICWACEFFLRIFYIHLFVFYIDKLVQKKTWLSHVPCYIESWTKWLIFLRQHLQMNFLEICFYILIKISVKFVHNFLEICFYILIKISMKFVRLAQLTCYSLVLGTMYLGNGLAQHRCQVITWINYDTDHWYLGASSDLKELIHQSWVINICIEDA